MSQSEPFLNLLGFKKMYFLFFNLILSQESWKGKEPSVESIQLTKKCLLQTEIIYIIKYKNNLNP